MEQKDIKEGKGAALSLDDELMAELADLASRCSICGDPLADSIKVYDTPDGPLCSTCWNYQPHPLGDEIVSPEESEED